MPTLEKKKKKMKKERRERERRGLLPLSVAIQRDEDENGMVEDVVEEPPPSSPFSVPSSMSSNGYDYYEDDSTA